MLTHTATGIAEIHAAYHEAVAHVGDVGHNDGQKCSLRDGLGRVLQISRHVGPCSDPCHGRKEDREDSPKCLSVVVG